MSGARNIFDLTRSVLWPGKIFCLPVEIKKNLSGGKSAKPNMRKIFSSVSAAFFQLLMEGRLDQIRRIMVLGALWPEITLAIKDFMELMIMLGKFSGHEKSLPFIEINYLKDQKKGPANYKNILNDHKGFYNERIKNTLLVKEVSQIKGRYDVMVNMLNNNSKNQIKKFLSSLTDNGSFVALKPVSRIEKERNFYCLQEIENQSQLDLLGKKGAMIFDDGNCDYGILVKKQETKSDAPVIGGTTSVSVFNEKIMLDDDELLQYFLWRFWGFREFRKGQLEIIKRAVAGADVLGILPTGAGKSLCYQLPAILGEGTSLVISPLVSLMQDQLDALFQAGFDFAASINSSMTRQEKEKASELFQGGHLKLLYISPERMQMQDFLQMIENSKVPIEHFIVDEVHCVSEWGHDFRPSYLKLIDRAGEIAAKNIVAVTATASQLVQTDILEIFNLKPPDIVRGISLDRPGIGLEVKKVGKRDEKLAVVKEFVQHKLPQILDKKSIEEVHNEGSGLCFTIYACPRGKNTEKYGTGYWQEQISQLGIDAMIYHGRMNNYERAKVQREYMENRFPLLVCTKGFGLGIDKGDINYVLHTCFPNSLEAYYQEAGRAGRKGQKAYSIIFAAERHHRCGKGLFRRKKKVKCSLNWQCYFTGKEKCDYGMQLKFIQDQYPEPDIMEQDLKIVAKKLALSKTEDVLIIPPAGEESDWQKHLFYYHQEGLIEDFTVAGYKQKSMVIRVRKKNKASRRPINKGIRSIVNKLQSFKEQRLNMLDSMWEYVANEKICRRQYLMEYFGEKVSYAQGCGFCDVDGRGKTACLDNEGQKKLREEICNLLQKRNPDLKKARDLMEEIYEKNLQERVRIMAMACLEEDPNNFHALFIVARIAIENNPDDLYGQDKLFKCLKLAGKMARKGVIEQIIAVFYPEHRELILLLLTEREIVRFLDFREEEMRVLLLPFDLQYILYKKIEKQIGCIKPFLK